MEDLISCHIAEARGWSGLDMFRGHWAVRKTINESQKEKLWGKDL